MKELEKTYSPSAIEERLYDKWLKGKYFHAAVNRSKKPFTIVMPPPNITGQLHMGHALDSTLQDILTRFKRMQGYSALWLPGTDHAGIAPRSRWKRSCGSRRARPGMTWAVRSSSSACGSGRKSTAAALSSSRRSWRLL